MTKTYRLNEVMVRIYEKKKFTVDELAEEFQVSYRTMLRYLQELSGMGVPLYSEVGKHGGYSIVKSSSPNNLTGSFKRVIKPMTHIIGVEFKAPFTAVYMTKVRIPIMWEELNSREHEIINPINKESRINHVVETSRTEIDETYFFLLEKLR